MFDSEILCYKGGDESRSKERKSGSGSNLTRRKAEHVATNAISIVGPAGLDHTPNHLECPACDAARDGSDRDLDGGMVFQLASTLWLDMLKADVSDGGVAARRIRATTESSYSQYLRSLNLFFGEIPLNKIHRGNLKEYQRMRLNGLGPFVRRRRPHEEPRALTVSPKKVNQELAALRQVMQCADMWKRELEVAYKPLLEEESEAQRAMQPDEQDLWLRTAQQKERWRVVYWYSLLAIGATLSTNEMRFLRLGDISLYQQTVTVAGAGAKCAARRRTNALLTADQLWAAEKLLERARMECGCTAPQHYLFPFRNRKYSWDPSRPMSTSGIKREWQEVRDASGLLWVRQYDLRHTGSTRNAEDNMPDAVRDRRMGHRPNSRMREHYTHVDAAFQRRAYEKMAARKLPPQTASSGGVRVLDRYA